MLPLIVWASFQSSFLNTYPVFKPWIIKEVFGLPHWQMGATYEFFYGLDFLSIELLFRGALVVGMIKILGKDSILPMAAAYAFLHYGKPFPETLGSVFGGYILGIIALRTGNIWGGCLIHIGVAYMMDFVAYIQHYWRGDF